MQHWFRWVFVLLIAVFMISSVSEAREPDWVTRMPSDPALLQGVGSAKSSGDPESDRVRADNAAVAQIARQIRVQVTSTLSSYYREEVSESGVLSGEEGVERISSQFSEATLEGVTIEDRYFDKANGVYYTYAVISKIDLDRQFREKANRAVQLASDYHRFAQQALRNGMVVNAMNHYVRALEEIFPAQAYLQEKVFGDIDGNGRREAVQARLESELAGLLASVQFREVSGRGQKADRVSGLADPLVGKVEYRMGSGAVLPVASAPLTVRMINAKGKISSTGTTDGQGRFEVRVLGIDEAEEEVVLVQARLDLGGLDVFREQLPSLFAQVKRTALTFEFRVDVASSVRVFVHLRETEGGRDVGVSSSASRLEGELVKDEYRVLDLAAIQPEQRRNAITVAITSRDDGALASAIRGNADYAVLGIVEAVVSDSINTGYPIVFARAGAQVRIVDLASAQIVASSTVSEVKGSGNNSRKAFRSAIERCTDEMIEEIRTGLKSALR
jgi:hypothetical protein